MIRSQIPETLWQDDILLIPPALADALRDELRGRRLYEEACVEDTMPRKCVIAVRIPKSNLEYWRPKFRRNRKRDKEAVCALTALGWRVLVIWECDGNAISTTLKRLSRK